jgi:hypothetical protein
MPALLELQARFGAALLRDDADGLAGAIVGDGLAPAARAQVYRNHVFTSLTDALSTTYPVVCRLVDRRFFGYASDRYIRRHPPAGPCLFEYGATFGEFLATFPPCAGHPYLADVARLEWAMQGVLHAEDATPLAPAALAGIPLETAGRLTFRFDPAAAWLQSPWPIDRIWRANQPDADPDTTVDLGAGGVRLEIRRQADNVVTMRRLAPAEFALRSALGAGASLETAAETAATADPDFDLTEALRALLGEALLVGFTTMRAKGDSQ